MNIVTLSQAELEVMLATRAAFPASRGKAYRRLFEIFHAAGLMDQAMQLAEMLKMDISLHLPEFHDMVSNFIRQNILDRSGHFDFDSKMDLEKLTTIICNIQESGLIVKAAVMDMGNPRLQSDLNVANMKYKFDNPSMPGESILIIPDPIHGLKNLQNAILNHGAVINWRGKSVPLNKDHFWRVIMENCKPGEASFQHKIDLIGNLELTDQEKQRVDKAFQLLVVRTRGPGGGHILHQRLL